MSYIPKDARWYIAELILEFVVEDDVRNLVYVNIHLIEANSPNEAYDRALALGSKSEDVYLNTEGREVRHSFRALAFSCDFVFMRPLCVDGWLSS